MNITSEIKKAATPVELMLVMDTTGSMGTTYMAQAKTAAHNLLTKVYGGTLATEPESEYIRVGLVPFSGAVRLDTAASDFNMSWIDTTGAAAVSKLNFSNSAWHNYMAWTQLLNQPWNGCVEARTGSYATDDTAPGSGNTLFTPYFNPDEPTFSNSTSLPNNYLNSYIGSTGTPNETTGITTANCTGWSSSSTSTANLTRRQNNVSKYIAKSITAETNASSSTGPWFNCAKSKLVSLTYDRSKVEAGIDAMTANGSTVIPEGLAWGWRAMSPTAPLTTVGASTSFPQTTIAPYGDARWQKIMVLMSDGENDVLSNGGQLSPLNGTWYSAYGRGKAATNNRFGLTSTQISNFSSNPGVTATALDTKMAAICDNIKAQGIIIYSVGFRVNSTAMQNCASPDTNVNNKHYSYAADGVALAAVFSHIGENVSNTSIYLSK